MSSRRRFLRVLGASAIGGLAGCGGGGEDPPADDDTGGGNEGADTPTPTTEQTTTTETTTTTTTTTTGAETPVEPGQWPMLQGGPQHVGVSPGAGVGPQSPTVDWRHGVGSGVTTDPVVDADSMYVGTDDGRVYALSRSDGSVRWDNNYPRMQGLAVEGDTLYVSADRLYALNVANGNRRWRYSISGRPTTPPVVHNGTAYVASDEPRLYAVSGGERKWRTLTMTGYIPTPAVTDDAVYMGHGRGLSRLYLSGGAQEWQYITGGQATGAPTVRDGRVITPFVGGLVSEVNASDKADRIEMQLDQGSQASTAVTESAIYATTTGAKLYKLNREEGEVTWSVDLGNPSYSPPAVSGDYVYAADNANVQAFSREESDSVWAWEIGEAVRGGVAPVDGTLYVATGGWSAYAVSTPE